MNRRLPRSFAFVLALAALLPQGCAKSNPTSPGGAAGAPVILNYSWDTNLSRQVRIWGSVKNQSGRTIYGVRVEATIYFGDPQFTNVTDTSAVLIPVLANDSVKSFATYTLAGDRLVDAAPLWSYLPPTAATSRTDSAPTK